MPSAHTPVPSASSRLARRRRRTYWLRGTARHCAWPRSTLLARATAPAAPPRYSHTYHIPPIVPRHRPPRRARFVLPAESPPMRLSHHRPPRLHHLHRVGPSSDSGPPEILRTAQYRNRAACHRPARKEMIHTGPSANQRVRRAAVPRGYRAPPSMPATSRVFGTPRHRMLRRVCAGYYATMRGYLKEFLGIPCRDKYYQLLCSARRAKVPVPVC
ncbi:hypothetical protein BV25DRAFT_274736 [Artomyces pyxidatus]|uniref:Uncharacterized protein n=1 Tax=Artomyces pyxidatus TaxID=48021 RepID=A0ACB8T781_9AGAM|nr:hypothetical protein BV25DRAFT_274736 [Artomyces pyxidatus]